MIEYREDHSDLVEIVVDGRVGKAEFDAVAAGLEAAIARHGKLRVLEEVKSFGGIEPAAFWADLGFVLRHLNHFSRCAVRQRQALDRAPRHRRRQADPLRGPPLSARAGRGRQGLAARGRGRLSASAPESSRWISWSSIPPPVPM